MENSLLFFNRFVKCPFKFFDKTAGQKSIQENEILTITLPKKFAASMTIELESSADANAEIIASAYYKGQPVGVVRQTPDENGLFTIDFTGNAVFDRLDILNNSGTFSLRNAIVDGFFEEPILQIVKNSLVH